MKNIRDRYDASLDSDSSDESLIFETLSETRVKKKTSPCEKQAAKV